MNQPDLTELLLLEWERNKAKGLNVTLDELCKNSPEQIGILEQEIHRLEDLNALLTIEDRTEDATQEIEELPPEIPGYQIIKSLGSGAMGNVYQATHSLSGRTVAIKFMKAHPFSSAARAKRFQREAQVLFDLKHAHIIRIYEVNVQQGQPYFIMDYVSGGSLREHLSRFHHQPRVSAELIEKIASGVEVAHQKNIIHRDLKPENILLDRDGLPQVGDFGLAKLLDETEFDSNSLRNTTDIASDLTTTGGMLGTALYMAPEQFTNSRNLGCAADVWALGLMLYELIAGKHPFTSKNIEEITLGEIRQAICGQELPTLGLRESTQVKYLQSIIGKCLNKTPEHRYASASELAADLRLYLQDIPPKAYPEGWLPAVWRRCKNHPGMTATWSICCIVLISMILVVRSSSTSADPAIIAYHQSVQTHLERLSQQEPIVLYGPNQQNLAHLWKAGAGRVNYSTTTEGEPCVMVSSNEPALLEILPDPKLESYRILVEIRHDESNDNWGDVGIYFGYSQYQTSQGIQRFFGRIGFADLGKKATIAPLPNGRKGSEVALQFWRLGESQKLPVTTSLAVPKRIRFKPTMRKPGKWRRIELCITPNRVVAFWEGRETPLGTISTDEFYNWLINLQSDHPYLQDADIVWNPRGALGIYIYGGVASIRSIQLLPMP